MMLIMFVMECLYVIPLLFSLERLFCYLYIEWLVMCVPAQIHSTSMHILLASELHIFRITSNSIMFSLTLFMLEDRLLTCGVGDFFLPTHRPLYHLRVCLHLRVHLVAGYPQPASGCATPIVMVGYIWR